MLNDIVADDRASIDIVRAAQAAGGESRTAGLGGEAQLETDQALAPPVEQELAQARHALAGLVGQAPEPGPRRTSSSPPSRRRPRSRSPCRPPWCARGRTSSRPRPISTPIPRGSASPRPTSIRTSISSPGLTQEALTPASIFSFNSTAYDFGAQATAPLFHGGALRAERRAAEAQARASLAHYRQDRLERFHPGRRRAHRSRRGRQAAGDGPVAGSHRAHRARRRSSRLPAGRRATRRYRRRAAPAGSSAAEPDVEAAGHPAGGRGGPLRGDSDGLGQTAGSH